MKIVSKHKVAVRVCGLLVIDALLSRFTSDYAVHVHYADGDALPPGATLCTIQSDVATLLMLERTILNFLRHLCAVATLTRTFVDAVVGTPLKILDTRKTLPGLRHLEKYAVHCGGGVNHRMGLYDAIMIKNNHVDLLGGMQATLTCLQNPHHLPVIIEVRNQAELAIALAQASTIERVLLDNMSNEELSVSAALCRGKLTTEASGNLTIDRIRSIAETGVDYASIGAITHSAGNVDLSMRVVT